MRDSSIAGLAKVLSKDINISVTVSGDTSYIDQKGNINIAIMPSTAKGKMLATGLLFHEIGHKNHSNLSSKPPGLTGHIANIIEDIRIEAKTIAERPGTRFNLDEVITFYANTGDLNPTSLSHAICGKAMSYGRRMFLQQNGLKEVEKLCNGIMDDAFGESFVDELTEIVKDIAFATNSKESVEIAKRIESLIINQKPQPQQESNTKQQEPKEEEDNGNCSNQGERSGHGGDEQEAEENGTEDSRDIGGEKQEENPGHENSADGNEESPCDKTNDEPNGGSEYVQSSSEQDEPDESISGGTQSPRNLSSSGSGAGGKLSAQDIDDLMDVDEDYGDLSKMISNEIDSIAQAQAYGENLKEPMLPPIQKDKSPHPKLNEIKAISAASKMRAKMMGMLQDIKRSPESCGASGKKLKTGKLVKIAFGDPKIFTRKKEVKDVNTAIVICIDYSGSMCNATRVSNPAAYSVHHALHGLKGAAVASIGFGCIAEDDQPIFLLVDFKEKPTSDKFNISAQGGTPTHEAIWAARAMLLARPEPRKVILIITDGDPNSSLATTLATERTEKDGIEVAAIGIQTSCVKSLWKKSKCIDEIEELPQAMFTVLDELLTERK